MTIVKTIQFRKNLKNLLHKAASGDDEVYLKYYDQYFQIKPVQNPTPPTPTTTQTQHIIQKYSQRKPQHPHDQSNILNNDNPTQEKATMRKIRYAQNH